MSASIASAYSEANFKHDVFISFRGADTRNKFTSHLRAALDRKQLEIFMDDESDRGEEIVPSFMKAIEESRTSVVIISENFANSAYCLDELLKILDCKKTRGQIVLPVFYDVDPSDVENQTGTFGDAFEQLRNDNEQSILDKWSHALKEAANLGGLDSRKFRNEHDLTEKVADFIWEKLSSESTESTNSNGLVGMDSRVKKIQSSFENSTDIFVGVWGMGGIGKTTTVEVLFNRISNQFDGHCFIRSIREKSEQNDLIHILKEILCEVLQETYLPVKTLVELPAPILRRLRRKKVLIVLDDVSDENHLKLAGNREWFCPGSRVILTGRDKQILTQKAEIICPVEGLSKHEAFRLFSLKAFEDGNPPENYMYLSKSIVAYTKGVPLALIILGSSLRGKDEEKWSSKLNKLEESPDLKIQKVLRISYDELDLEEKKIFLDIACFFKGEDEKRVTRVLDGCGFYASYNIDRLKDKCLINVVNNKLEMHDLLQDMGCDIVRQESFEDSGKRSRLWVPKEISEILTSNKGTKAIEGLFLDTSEIENIKLNHAAFSTMQNLRLLKFYNNTFDHGEKFVSESSLSNDLQSLPNSLRYLHWDGYPWKSLPTNFSLENLVELRMPHSQIEYLWSEENHPQKLRHLDLSGSFCLNRLPHLFSAQNLERIILNGCISLQEIPPSIQHLHSLTHLILSGCRCLKSLPSLIDLKSLKILDLSYCSNLEKLPEIPEAIEELRLHWSGLKEWSPSTQSLNKVKLLTLDNCAELTSLPSSIHLNSLETLDLSGCYNLQKFPDVTGNIKKLFLKEAGIKELPPSIGFLSSLAELIVGECQNLPSLLSSICELTCLEVLEVTGCSKFAKLPTLSGLCSLSSLCLTDCGILEIPNDICDLSSLQKLCLRGNQFESLPAGIKQLAQLKTLDLNYCKKLRCLPELPSGIHELTTHDCTMLETVSIKALEFSELGDAYKIEFFNCTKLDQNACNNILADAWSRILEIARGLEKHSNEIIFPEASFTVCLPGCEIPEWCGYRNDGPSITIALPHGWCNNRFAGLIYCAIIECDYNRRIFKSENCDSVFCECCFENDDGVRRRFYIGCNLFQNWVFLESSHLVMWYEDKYQWLRRECYSKNKGSFKFTYNTERKVIRCGVHILYREDEDATSTRQPELMQIDNDTELSDEEPQSKNGNETELSDEEPQSKRLKVSTIQMVALFFIACFFLVFVFFYL